MTRKTGRVISLSLIAIVLVAAMIFSFTVAENVTPAEAKKVVNTTTDSSQITTPFTSVISAVQESVVGLNNYQQFNYSTSRSFGARGARKSVEQLAGTGSGVVMEEPITSSPAISATVPNRPVFSPAASSTVFSI